MHPKLNPAAQRSWRDQTTLQLWSDPDRAIAFAGVGPAVTAFLDRLDGSRSADQLLAEAAARGPGAAEAARILELLDDAGLLLRGPSLPAALGRLPVSARDRLAAEVAASAASSTSPAECVGRRLEATVRLVGGGRLLLCLARLLAAAGVGSLLVSVAEPVGSADVGVDGYRPGDAGRPEATVLRELLGEFVNVISGPVSGRPTLVVALSTDVRRLGADLVRAGAPHVWVEVRPELVRVGPFVSPGRSACSNCLDLHREERDPKWPAIAAQAVAVQPGGTLQNHLAAGLAASQVLAFLDGEPPSALNATLECRPPHWLPRRRSWLAHPNCCGPG